MLNKIFAAYKLGGVKLCYLLMSDSLTNGNKAPLYLNECISKTTEAQYKDTIENLYLFIEGRKLDLAHPVTFNEKIQWLKLYDSSELKTRLADKFLVRKWIAEKIGEQYLVPIIGVYDCVEDINFDTLPNRFVLKANHGSGWNIIVKDKDKANIDEIKDQLKKWLSTNFAFREGFELHYRDIKPRIIAEEYIDELGGYWIIVSSVSMVLRNIVGWIKEVEQIIILDPFMT